MAYTPLNEAALDQMAHSVAAYKQRHAARVRLRKFRHDSAFSVDFLRRQQPEPEPDSFPISGKDGDVFPVKANRAELFMSSRVFEQPIVSLNGRMTFMRTISPQTFVAFKRWMSQQPDREFLKKGRDRRQADAVQQLIDDGRLEP